MRRIFDRFFITFSVSYILGVFEMHFHPKPVWKFARCRMRANAPQRPPTELPRPNIRSHPAPRNGGTLPRAFARSFSRAPGVRTPPPRPGVRTPPPSCVGSGKCLTAQRPLSLVRVSRRFVSGRPPPSPLFPQTGSGKTYTMEGPPNDRGVNFRTMEELFAMIAARQVLASSLAPGEKMVGGRRQSPNP